MQQKLEPGAYEIFEPCADGCNSYKGGKDFQPYPTYSPSEWSRGYDDKDLLDPLFRALVDIAAEAWDKGAAAYVKDFGDVGTCVGGAGIAISYRKPRCRKYERKLILRPPHSATQGASTWEHDVQRVVAWLKAHGIECWYHCGYMD